MSTENPVRLIGGSSGARNWPIAKDAAPFTSSTSNVTAHDFGLLLQGPSFHGNTNIAGPNRSGSAPPTIQGSSLAIGDLRGNLNPTLEGIFQGLSTALPTSESEEQLRADPAYRAYYYSNVNLNPRLPQPLLSREKPRPLHHVGAFGENWRRTSFDDSTKKPFTSPPVLSTHKEEPEDDRSPRLDSDGKGERDSGFISTSLQGRHKSLVDLIQEDFPRTPSPVYNNQSHLANQGTIEQADPDPGINILQESSINISKAESKTATIGICSQTPIASAHSVGSGPNIDLTSSLIALPTSSDIKLNPHPGQKGESRTFNVNLDNGILPSDKAISSTGGVDNETKNLRLSHDLHRGQPAHQHPQQENLHPRGSLFQGMPSSSNAAIHFSHSQPNLPSAIQPVLQPAGSAPPLYATASAYGNPYYPNIRPSSLFPPFSFGGYALNTSLVSPFVTGYQPYTAIHMPLETSASPNLHLRTSGLSGGSVTHEADVQHLYKFYGQFGVAPQPSFPDPIYMPYFQHSSVNAYASAGQYDPTAARESTIRSPAGNYDLQLGPRAAAQSPEQRPRIVRSGAANSPGARKGGAASPNNSVSPPNIGIMLHYPSSPLASPVYQGSPVAAGRRNENMRFQVNSSRNEGAFFGWQGQRGREKFDEQKTHSFLEELKSSKARRYELSDIAGRLVEFSADQHGSRFIQQKLETCNAEEKASVFEEVLPHASKLMTDVFGNYVIQKFLEHGSPAQRKGLANKLVGNILPLSLQMYGCRVIQKALEVIELDQKTQLVHELNGHVMRCVRDQNGNHVIQKCIECVPTEKIDFIISSFRGNVATLSMHPYGCRVIQRVLEHCTDELQIQCIVNEILQSACILAQDQYGNYVTQHVLERGRPLERSQIISKLAGQIVQMSQHKFASNVIEKCLQHGTAGERDILIEEIVGQTEGNDNLLVMMKDQFANYVVQKILETCNDKQQEILLSRIKVHVQALKKYTYGKHIVARIEQLCGEDSHDSES